MPTCKVQLRTEQEAGRPAVPVGIGIPSGKPRDPVCTEPRQVFPDLTECSIVVAAYNAATAPAPFAFPSGIASQASMVVSDRSAAVICAGSGIGSFR